jgi:hypothetical protein
MKTQNDLTMIASPFYPKLFPFKTTPGLLRHVRPSALACFLFIALGLVASVKGTGASLKEAIPCRSTKGSELARGYLMVYSATDSFDDSGVLYYPHSSYTVCAAGGKFCKTVTNRNAPSDKIPERVTLPIGSYTVDARTEHEGYVRMHVTITAGRLTVLHLEGEPLARN